MFQHNLKIIEAIFSLLTWLSLYSTLFYNKRLFYTEAAEETFLKDGIYIVRDKTSRIKRKLIHHMMVRMPV